MKIIFIYIFSLLFVWEFAEAQSPIQIEFIGVTAGTQQADITNAAFLFFQNLLKMSSQASTKIANGVKSCVNNCHLLMIIDNTDTDPTVTGYPCTNGMPFTIVNANQQVGTIKMCGLAATPSQPLKNNFIFKQMVDSVIHGIQKVLVGSSITTSTSNCSLTSPQGCSGTYPYLKTTFTQYYPYSTLANMPVTQYQDVGSSLKYYLWYKNYAYEDLMTDNYQTENKFWSALNNQILKDILLTSTTTKISSVNDNMVQQITISNADSCQTKDSNQQFCLNTQTSLSCNASFTAKSRCTPLNPTDSNSCRVFSSVTQGNCLNPQYNTDLQATIQQYGTFEYYGWNSRCFLSDIQAISSTFYSAPVRCYTYSCDSNNNVSIYLDQSSRDSNGNLADIDIVTCTVAMQGTNYIFTNSKYYSKTGITCPSNNAQFCGSKPTQCKNFCSSQGVCVANQCVCNPNYYGDDCSCFHQNQENGVCVAQCSSTSKMTASPITGICSLKCPNGQYFNDANQTCQKCAANCLTCQITSTTCDSCNTDFVLAADKTCRYTYPTQTKACTSSQFYDATATTPACSPCSSTCSSCVYLSTFCTSCLSNQYLQNGTCNNCPTNCLSCTGNQLCTQCSSTTYLNSLKNQCLSSCPSPNYGYNNTCVATCPDGYYADTSTSLCKACDSSCLTCSVSSTQCVSCQYYQKLDSTTNKCINQCSDGYVYVRQDTGGINWNFQCISCNFVNKCSQCVGSPTQCTQCLTSFFLYNSTCLETCPSAYYADSTLGQCIKCDTTCLTCSNKSTTCTSCNSGFYLKNGSCVSTCGDGYVVNTDTNNCDPSTQTSDQTSSNSQYSANLRFSFIKLIMVMIASLLVLQL